MSRNGIYKTCIICTKGFYVSTSHAKQKFCSSQCYGKYLVDKPGNGKGVKRTPISIPTAFKKGAIPWNKGLKGYGAGHKMSLESINKRRLKVLGRKTPIDTRIKQSLAKTKEIKFTNFRSSINKQHRLSVDWKIWREKVFIRDNYTCQKCFRRGIYIEPHHLITVKECIEKDNKLLIYNTDNGLTLCRDCHKQIHNWKTGKK